MASTSVTVKPGGGGNYTSLAAAYAGEAANLTAITPDLVDQDGNATIALRITVSGGADTAQAVFSGSGYTTDATHRIEVVLGDTNPGPRWDASIYRLSANPGYLAGALRISGAVHADFVNFQVEDTGTRDGSPCAVRIDDVSADVRFFNGFQRLSSTSGTNANSRAFLIGPGTNALKLRMQNTVIATTDSTGLESSEYVVTGSDLCFSNLTIVNRSATGRIGFSVGGASGAALRARNLLIQGPGTTNYYAGTFDESVTILTQDTTGTSGLQSKTLTFVDAANWDYHLASGDISAIGVGTDLSSATYYPFSTDGDGNSRPNGAWDVGAHEYGAGAPAAGRPAWRNMTRIADRAIAVARW